MPAALLLSLMAPLCAQAQAVDCAALLREHLKSDLALSIQAFDQTEGQGFRVLADQPACAREAGDLIEAYIAANAVTGKKGSSLRWHLAQMRATEGNAAAAVAAARTVLDERDDRQPGQLRWNDYVRATIAFLERDREALQSHRDAVAAGRDEHFGNALNLKLLDALLRHYERGYAYATAHIE